MAVFVPNVPLKKDDLTGQMVPAINLHHAERFGEVKLLSDIGEDFENALCRIGSRIDEVSENDYILGAGDVVLISAALSYVIEKYGKVKILRWDKNQRKYNVVEFDLWAN